LPSIQKYSAQEEQRLMTELWDPAVANSPLTFVMMVYPWGKPGTPLEYFEGPRAWQREELERIEQHIKDNQARMIIGETPEVYQSATASGRGIGKSTLVAWINHWMQSCHIGSTAITTANTEGQLKTKTWGEVGKWLTLAINGHWFDKATLSVRPAAWFAAAIREDLKIDDTYYYSLAQTWSEENPDSFAGAHNPLGMLIHFDESSGIPEPIWTVTEGFFTEPVLHRYWITYSNPRRNTGAFYYCFHKHRQFWLTRNLDSRTVEGTDTNVLNKIITKHGEDSDEARIEVKGQFPRTGDNQFISREIVEQAQQRELIKDEWAGLVMGVDPARFGDDSTVIFFRQGRNGRVIDPLELKSRDNMFVANKCAELIDKYNPDAVCIDAGNGTGIIDRLREMRYKVHEVWFGGKSDKPQWADKRTEIWGNMAEWLQGACIPEKEGPEWQQRLEDDLVNPEYDYVKGSDVKKLESKKDMKKRGLPSPDWGDALACTFARRVAHRNLRASRNSRHSDRDMARDVDYDLFPD